MNLYVHIPFCRRACGYCDFHRSITRANIDSYAAEICCQMELFSDFSDGRLQRIDNGVAQCMADGGLHHIYIGGGTPTAMSPEALQSILDCAHRIWGVRGEEVTLEANPDDLTDDYLRRLAATDFNRLSIGIQSFNDDELRFMNRRHSAQQAIQAVALARQYGFANISIDLIYGLPHSTVQSWQVSINQAIAMHPEHISAYHLSIEEGTAFARLGVQPVSGQTSEAQYNLLHDTLVSAGYEHYEISNFALPSYRSRHNSDYWNGTPYLGLGEGAHSYDGLRHRFQVSGVRGQVLEEFLTDEELYEEMVMLRLRTADGLNIEVMREKLGAVAAARFVHLAEPFIASERLSFDGSTYRIPHRHWLVSDAIIRELAISN